jgi:nucleoside-diphosphate-sugar epimerase
MVDCVGDIVNANPHYTVGMRVFVAGATGAVGRPLVSRLLADGHSVTAITRSPEKAFGLRDAGAAAVVCDVFDRAKLSAVVRDIAPDAIIHQLTDLPASMNPRMLQAIYERNNRVRREGTANLLGAAKVGSVRRFIVQSMGTWYRPEGAAVKSESEPLWTDAPEPIGTAVRTVADMEAVVTRESPIAVVLRYGAFYGPGTWYAADGELARRMRARSFPMIAAGSGITSFIHVDDAATAAIAALSATASGIYNIADDEPAAASVWMPVYAAAIGAPPPRSVPTFLARWAIGKPLATWLTTMRGASNERAKRELGWSPRYASWRAGFPAIG